MLARSMKLTLNGKIVGETPMLVPAFSSKVNPAIGLVIESMEDYMSGPILVSAYDIANESSRVKLPIIFGEIIFLDSGGYECSQDADLADTVYPDYEPKEWTPEKHCEVINKWPNNKPTVVVSFDHPKIRKPIKQQIEAAIALFAGRKDVLTEILLKPETGKQRHIKLESIFHNIEALRVFDIIGVAEKELGSSLLDRLENAARIRLALDEFKIDKPLHIFGSLDPIACPLLFIAGVDIFDGLTWLRYGFIDGLAVYEQHYGVISQPFDYNDGKVRISRLVANLAELNKIRQQMTNYLLDGDFRHFKHLKNPQDIFKPHQELLEDVYTALRSRLKSRGKEV